MARLSILLIAASLAIAACGDDEDASPSGGDAAEEQTASERETTKDAPVKPETSPARATGTTITLGQSEFGSMLFDSKRQAIYIFQRDPKGKTACYGECAEAWPPVYTEGAPEAGPGVKPSLLGTVKRRDGRLQVTYADQPLYFYVNEGPGEVRCHNVNLNGGLWWVIGPDGKRRA